MPKTAATLMAYAAQSLNRGQHESVETCKMTVHLLFPSQGKSFKAQCLTMLKSFACLCLNVTFHILLRGQENCFQTYTDFPMFDKELLVG